MQRYKNLSGKSGITYYSIGEDFIEIKFKDIPGIYIYSNELCGKGHIEKMKALASKGRGLATYVSQHPQVKDHFHKREP